MILIACMGLISCQKEKLLDSPRNTVLSSPPLLFPQDTLKGREFIFENLSWVHAGPGAIGEEEIWIGVENRPDLFSNPQRQMEVAVKFDTSTVWLNIPKWNGTLVPSSIGFVHLIMYASSFYVESHPMNFRLQGRKASLKIKFL